MPLGGADRGQHPELTKPTLGEDDEACRRDEGDEGQQDRCSHEDPGRGHHALVAGPATGDRSGTAGCPERLGAVGTSLDQDRHGVRVHGLVRIHQGEVVAEVARVLDHAHDRPPTIEDASRSDPGLQGLEQALGHGDLAVGPRVAPVHERQHRRGERAPGILGPEFDRLEGAG